MKNHELVFDERQDGREYGSRAHVQKPEGPKKKKEQEGFTFKFGMTFHAVNLTQDYQKLQGTRSWVTSPSNDEN